MKTGIFKYYRRDSGFELKRLVAMLLVLVQCASLAFVGAPVAYAETEDPQDAVVVTQDGEPSQDPDEEEDVIEEEDEPEPEPEPEPEDGELEADLGDGFAVTLFYGADAGIPADATLEIRVPELPPEHEEDYAPDALYLTENDLAYYEGRMFEALGVTDNDPVFETMLFELRIFDAEGEPVIPACPVEVRIRFPEADGTMAETFAAVSFDETGVFGTEESTTPLGTSGWSDDEGCMMDFEVGELALFGVCSWAKQHLTLQMGNAEISVFAPACAQVWDDNLTFTPEENLLLEKARSLHASSDAPYGETALWAVLSGGDGAETNEALYSLVGKELFEHLHPSEDEDALIPLGEVNGFALLTINPDVPLHSDGTLTLTGEAPVGVVVNTEDVSDQYVDFDFASLTESEPEPEPAPELKPIQFSPKASTNFMQNALAEMLTEAVQEQAASEAPKAEESRPWYDLIGAYDISLSLDGDEYQPDADHPIEVRITDPAIDRGLDLRLWHIHGDKRERVNFWFDDDRDNTIVFTADSFSEFVLFSVTKEQTLTTPDGLTYLITVTYDASAGIPRDAILEVSEILPDDPRYDEYLSAGEDLLAQKHASLVLARPFDISLIDPETDTHCQPDKSVRVSITLLDEDLQQYEKLGVIHFPDDTGADSTLIGCDFDDGTISFEADGFSGYLVAGYTVAFQWGDYSASIPGGSGILLSALFEELGVNEIAIENVENVSSSDPLLVEVSQETDDWRLTSKDYFEGSQTLTLTLKNGNSVEIAMTSKPNPEVTAPSPIQGLVYTGEAQTLVTEGSTTGGTLKYSLSADGEYSADLPVGTNAGTYTVYYLVEGNDEYSSVAAQSVEAVIAPAAVTVTVTGRNNADNHAVYDGEEHAVTGYTAAADNELYDAEQDVQFTPAEGASQVDGVIAAVGTNAGTTNMGLAADQFANINSNFEVSFSVTDGYLVIDPASVILTANSAVRNYDDNEQSVTGFTSSVDGLSFPGVSAGVSATEKGVHPAVFTGVTLNVTRDTTGNYVVTGTVEGKLIIATLAEKTLTGFNGNLATYEIVVNPDAMRLNDGDALTVEDTFSDNQSINYGTITVTPAAGTSFDYSSTTGTFTVPDETRLTITYTTRVQGNAGDAVAFNNTTAVGRMDEQWGSVTVAETRTITPTGSDITGQGGVYTIELYTYADGHLERGLAGAEYRLLDYNQLPIRYKAGEKAGQQVTFETGANGYVTVKLTQEQDGVSIHKNTVYYLEMIKAPVASNGDGTFTYYQKDNTLYNFLITDVPSYQYGDIYSFFNGDVLKVRCYPESVGINVTKRFSGNYTLTAEQQNAIVFVLERETPTGGFEEVERHTYSEFQWGSMNFTTGSTGWEPRDYGATYRVRELNAGIDGVELKTTCVVSSQSNGVTVSEETNEFLVDPDHEAYSFSLIFTNEYAHHKLTIYALNEELGNLLPGVTFSVYAAQDPTAPITTYTTNDGGMTEVSREYDGGSFASDTLYYIVETAPPEGYLLPDAPEKFYFYFSENSTLVPDGLPSGETALDLSTSFKTVTVANSREKTHIPVIIAWGLSGVGTWPSAVDHVVVSLFRSVDGGEPEAVAGMTVSLNAARNFDNATFKDLPVLTDNGKSISYSLVETIYGDAEETEDLTNNYATTCTVSGTGWYVLRNQGSVSVTVNKSWLNLDGTPADTGSKPDVTFDLYRSTEEIGQTGTLLTREELEAHLASAEAVRTGLTLSGGGDWTQTVYSLPDTDSSGDPYYYFALENEDSMPQNNADAYVIKPADGSDLRTLTIQNKQTPVTVIIQASDRSKTYGEADPDFGFTVTVQDPDTTASWAPTETPGEYTVTVTPPASVGEAKTLTFTLTREAGEGVGSYALTPSGDPEQQGYRVRYEAGTLTVNRKSVVVTAGATKTYGTEDPELTAVSGLIDGDAPALIRYDVVREPGEDVGSYPIAVSGEAVQGNYNVSYVVGTLTITRASAHVKADALSKVYGEEDPELTATVTGLVADDIASVIEYSLDRGPGEDVGTYPVTVSGEAIQGNYNVSYENDFFTITQARVDVQVQSTEKVFGDNDPDWTVTVDGLQDEYVRTVAENDGIFTYTYKHGEQTILSFTLTRAAGEDVGSYALTFSGEASQGNYSVNYVKNDEASEENGRLTILPAELIVQPDDKVKGFTDSTDPDLTAVVTGWQFDDGSRVTCAVTESNKVYTFTYTLDAGTPEAETILLFTLRREPGNEIGDYAIISEGEHYQGNYEVSFRTGVFSILRVFNVDVIQVTSDLVDAAANPSYDYKAKVDLTGTGISSLVGFDSNGEAVFTLPDTGTSSNTRTLQIPIGAKLTVTQTSANTNYTTSITVDDVPYEDGSQLSCTINSVDDYYAIRFIHTRICLPVQAMASRGQTEEGATPVGSVGYTGIPSGQQSIDEDFARALQTSIGYTLPADKYYVYDHASLYIGDDQAAADVTAIRYDAEHGVWQYAEAAGDTFDDIPEEAVLRLYYLPKYICKIDTVKFYTLNAALEYMRNTGMTAATIELLLGNYFMPVTDKLTIPDGYSVTLTTAETEYEGSGGSTAVITRSAGLTDSMFTNNGVFTLDTVTLDGAGISANDAMVLNTKATAELTVTGNAALQNASGVNGGAVRMTGGAVTINGALTGNSAVNGGAVFAVGGTLTLSSSSVTENSATRGGALYLTGGTANVSGNIGANTADEGGALYLTGGTANVSGSITGCSATSGGAVFMTGGTVNSSGSVTGCSAANGGAFYMEGGSITVSAGSVSSNAAADSGGMLFATGGNVTVSSGTISRNTATSGNGGAICYTGPGSVTVSGGTLSGNTAASGNGGAIYQSSGTATLSGTINGANSAKNGAALYMAAGIAYIKGATIKANTPTEGGAVGVGATARLYLSGNTNIYDNKLSGEQRNIYLDVDSDEIINIPAENLNKQVGIYVADNVRSTRGEVCCSFGSYVGTPSTGNIKDDRGFYSAYSMSNKLYWGKVIKFSVRHLPGGFPPNTASSSKIFPTNNNTTRDYYPKSTEIAAYDLVMTLYNEFYSGAIQSGYVYSNTYVKGSDDYAQFMTRLRWDSENRKWVFDRHSGDPVDQNEITIYYQDAAYVVITNNSGYPLTVNPLIVMGKDAVADSYGYVTAINNVTQTTLLPITDSVLTIPASGSVRLLFPGAKNAAWSLNGVFSGANADSDVKYTLQGQQEQDLTLSADGSFGPLSGTLLNFAGGLYEIRFGEPTPICKVENGGTEHPFSRLTDAINYIKDPTTVLDTEKTATIEMLLDYQQPDDDILQIPEGYDITFTTAAAVGSAGAEGKTYAYAGQDSARATISRSSGDMDSAVKALINVTAAYTEAQCSTSLTISNLIFDGKALGQGGQGGAVNTSNVKVTISSCDFKGYRAARGGAVYTKWGSLSVTDSHFENCMILNTNVDKTGGGGVWTTAQVLTVDGCTFVNCSGTGQAQGGAIFHNIRNDGAVVHPNDSQKFPNGFSSGSETYIRNCSFSNCTAVGSGGTIESDAWKVYITDCEFYGSQTIKKGGNGGAINIYTNDNKSIPATGLLQVERCYFEDCSAPNGDTNGGVIRSLSPHMVVKDSVFKNASSNHTGGAISMSIKGTSITIEGCTFDGCTAKNQAGAIYAYAQTVTISDSLFKDCTAPTGGGVYQNVDSNGSSVSVSGSSFDNCSSTNSAGGALLSKAKSLSLSGMFSGKTYVFSGESYPYAGKDYTFNDCTASGNGGAVCHTGNSGQTVEDCVFLGCESLSSGGGAYFSNSKLTMSDTRFTDCRAVNNGGGLYVSPSGTASALTDCEFFGNRLSASEGKGGGLYVHQNTLTVSGGRFGDSEQGDAAANVAANGGGIYQSSGTLNLNGTAIYGCYATTAGGGVYHNGTLFAYGSVKNCSAPHGGGVYSNGDLKVTDTAKALTVESCKAKAVGFDDSGAPVPADGYMEDNLGGGIYKSAGLMQLGSDSTTVSSCEAWDGGGVYYASNNTFTFSKGSIASNKAANNGGGIYLKSNTLKLSGSGKLTGNEAAVNGGGVYQADGTFTMSGGEISGNKALNASEDVTASGGGVYQAGGTFQMTEGSDNASIVNNEAERGAGLFVADGQVAKIDKNSGWNRILYNHATLEGGGIAVGGPAAQLKFGHNVLVKENTMGDDHTECNVYLDRDENGIIVQNTDINSGSYIGVYASDDQEDAHGLPGMPFGTYGSGTNIRRFINDRRTIYYGVRGSDAGIMVWSKYVCKITALNPETNKWEQLYDADGQPAAYTTLKAAFDTVNNGSPALYLNGSTDVYTGAYHIEMLVQDYETTSAVTVNAGKDVTLTTASSDPEEVKHGLIYNGDPKHPYATVTRGGYTNTMITVKGSLALTGIIVDGADGEATDHGAIIRAAASGAVVTVGENATLQNGKTAKGGGAISMSNDNTTVNLEGGRIVNCSAAGADGGGAILLYGSGTVLNIKDGSSIENCDAVKGGGVYIASNGTLNMSGGTITGCSAESTGGGVAVSGTGARLNFSGDCVVTKNMLNGEACNVQLDHESLQIINAAGLGDHAKIGVYVSGVRDDEHPEQETSPYSNHGREDKPFGTWLMDGDTRLDSNLYSFINDRNGLYGGKNLDNSDDQNIYWLGRPLIEVTKLVQSDWSKDKDTEFTFKVKLSGEELANVSASEWFHSYGFNSDGELTFSLKHDDVRPVVLPAAIRGAHYTVTELLSDEQAAEFNTTIVKSAGSDQATVTAREISGVLSVTLTELTFTNQRVLADLTVTKNVWSEEQSDTDKLFHFTLTLDDRISKTYPCVDANGSQINGGLTFEEGVASVALKGGQSITIRQLPVKLGYIVEEKLDPEDQPLYRVRVSKDGAPSRVGLIQTGTIGEVETTDTDGGKHYSSSAEFTNNRLNIVCKITNKNRELLYYKDGDDTVPAIYFRLEDAFAQINSGGLRTANGGSASGTLRIEMVVPEYTMDESATLNKGKTVILSTAQLDDDEYPYNEGHDDGNGNTALVLRGYSGDSMIVNNGTLTIDKITLDGGSGSDYTSTSNGGIVQSSVRLTVNAEATLRNSAAGDNNGGAIWIGENAQLTMNGKIDNCSAAQGGGVYAKESFKTVGISGTISNCAADDDGGAIFAGASGNSVIINAGTTLSGNSAGDKGGAVYSAASVIVRGGTVESNTADGDGGGLYLGPDAAFNMSGGTVTGNVTSGNGGGLVTQSTARITGAVFTGNQAAAGNGGAICQLGGTLTLSGTINGANTAQNGAAIYTTAGVTNFSGASITGNIATNGGAVGMGADARLYFSGNTVVSGNTWNHDETESASNVFLNVDSNDLINVPALGLGSGADIGVYVADGVNLLDKHGIAARNFGTYNGSNPSNAGLGKFVNDRDTELRGMAGEKQSEESTAPYFIMWPGKDLRLKISRFDVKMDEDGKPVKVDDKYVRVDEPAPVKNAKFTLTNKVNNMVVWTGKSGEDGLIVIPWWKEETENGNTVVVSPGSTYELKQIEAGDGCVLPVGSWTASIGLDNSVTWVTQTTDEIMVNRIIDVEAPRENAKLGDTFVVFNDRLPRITFDANGGKLDGNVETRTFEIPFTATEKFYTYTITEKDPTWNTKFRDWAESESRNPTGDYTRRVKGDILRFYRKSDYDDLTLYAQWDKVVCKVTDRDDNLLYVNGEPAVYTTLEACFADYNNLKFTTKTGGTATARKIQMLVGEYELGEGVTLARSKTAILTTASTESKDDYPFNDPDGATVCTIKRGFDGGSMITNLFNLTLTNITLDGGKGGEHTGGTGGIVSVEQNYAHLTLSDGATLQNSSVTGSGGAIYVSGNTTLTIMDGAVIGGEDADGEEAGNVADYGGAVYAAPGASVVMTGGTIDGNACNIAGAGVYLADGSKLKLAGQPSFGGVGIGDDDTIDFTVGNWCLAPLAQGAVNGGVAYPYARQDIYFGEDPYNIRVNVVETRDESDDPLLGDDGSIWVWVESGEHYKPLTSFSLHGENPEYDNLKVFRNAQPDDVTGAAEVSGEHPWLYGDLDDGQPGFIVWNGSKGSRRVILRKVKGTDEVSLAGAVFDVHKGSTDGQLVTIKHNDGTSETLGNLTSGANGIIWVGDLPYGTYFLHETNPADVWFALIVDDPEFIAPDADPFITGPLNEAGAVSAAYNKNQAIIAAKQAAGNGG